MKFCKSTFSLSLLLAMPFGIHAMEPIAKNLIIRAGNKSIEIQKGHALSSGTIKHMVEDIGSIPDTLEFAHLEPSLELLKPYFNLGYLQDSHAKQQQLLQHSLQELALIINASNYLDMESVRSLAIKALAQKLVKEENLYQCLTNAKGLYDFALAPDMERAVAQEVLKQLPGLKNYLLLKQILNAHNGSVPYKKFTGHASSVESASFSPDGTQIVTASRDRSARLWNAQSRTQLRCLTGHTDWVNSASFSPDGTQIVTASSDKTARMWDVRSGAQLQCLTGHTEGASSASFSPDGTQIVTASGDHTARIWNAQSGAQLQCLTGHTALLNSASFSPDGTQIVTASSDHTARIWNAHSGAQLQCLTDHTSSVYSAGFSPDGKHIVTASDDRTARLWDSQSGTQLRCLTGHRERILSATFSPDSTQIVTVSCDNTIRLWDVQSGLQLQCLIGQMANSASFNPDGTQIVTTSYDNNAYIVTIGKSNLANWFATEIKPNQVACLHLLEKHLKLNLPLNAQQYPGFKISELPPTLRELINSLPQESTSLKDSWGQRAKNKWNNLSTITKWGIGSAAAVAAGYGMYTLANKYLPQHKK